MVRRDAVDQLRRVILQAAGLRLRPAESSQLDLPLWPGPSSAPGSSDLEDRSRLAHDLVLEFVLLIQAEVAGLVASPLSAQRRRFGLGTAPPLRLLAEWEKTVPAESEPWSWGIPDPARDPAYLRSLGHARALAEHLGVTPPQVVELVRQLFPVVQKADPLDDVPGLIYGHSLRHTLKRTGTGRLAFDLDRRRARGMGAVHTPPELARELIAATLRTPDEPGTADRAAGGPGWLALDPACGSGQFLLALAPHACGSGDAPRAAGGTIEEVVGRLAGLKRLFGVELNPVAARITAWNLSCWAANEACSGLQGRRGSSPDTSAALDGLFGPTFPYLLGTNVQVGNSLLVEPSSFSPGFIWERRFARAFDREEPGFDIVLGNPPWVGHGQAERIGATDEERSYFERLYPAGTQYKLTLYPLFIELALRLCRRGGRHGFLVPDSLLTGHHFSRIRRLLLAESDLLELTLVEAEAWPGVPVGHTVLYGCRRKSPGTPAPVSVCNRILRPPGRRSAQGLKNRGQDGTGGRSSGMLPGVAAREDDRTGTTGPRRGAGARRATFSESRIWIPSASYSPAGSAPLRIYEDEAEVQFLAQIQNAPFRFADVAWTYSGLIARYGQRSVQRTGDGTTFLLTDDRGQIAYRDSDASNRWRPALLSGSEVHPHRIEWRGGRVYMPDAHRDLNRVYKSGFELTRYQGPKVFLRQTGDTLTAAVDRDDLFCLNNLHLMGERGPAMVPPLLLAGVLMSGPLQRAYRISCLEKARPLAQIDLKAIEDLPYPCDSSGAPLGSGPAPARSGRTPRRLLRLVARLAETGEPAPFLESVEAAWRAGADPVGDDGFPGGQALALLLVRLLEMIEEAHRESPSQDGGSGAVRRRRSRRAVSALQRAFDAAVAIAFELPVELQT